MKKFLRIIPVLIVLLCGLTAHAQFLGYTSPQTVSFKALNGATAPTTAVVPNLGQSVHTLTYSISSPCTTGFSMTLRLEGSNDGITFFSISEDATDQNSGNIQGTTVAGLTAIGYYPLLRVNLAQIACASGQVPAVTAFYSGTSTSNPTAVGAFYQAVPYRKVLFQNQPTTSIPSAVTINSPTGSTAGALYISCFIAANGATTSCPSSLTITMNAFIAFGSAVGGGGGGNIVSSSGTFNVPGTITPIVTVGFAPAISMTWSFGGSGTAGTSWSAYFVFTSTPSSQFVGDPGQSSGAFKQSKVVDMNTATTTVIIPAVAGQSIYVCGASFAIGTSATTPGTFFLEFGTGANCVTGTTIITGSMGTETATAGIGAFPWLLPGGMTSVVAPSGNALCGVSAGTTVSNHGTITYVQQ
jgi:hypothetical protein